MEASRYRSTLEMQPMWSRKASDSDLEVVPLIPTASPSAAKTRSGAHQRWESVDGWNHWKNSRGGTLMSPNRTPSRARLRLDVGSMNITYRESKQAALSESDARTKRAWLAAKYAVLCARSGGLQQWPWLPILPRLWCIFDISPSFYSSSEVYVFLFQAR